jgi:hypothetical protein
MEFIPIEQLDPIRNGQNQFLSKPTPQPLPQVAAQAVPQSSTEAKTQFPKESSVTYDVPTIESILKRLSFYKPYELPPQSLLYRSAPTQQNTRILPSVTLPAVTIQSENGPIQTIAVELAPQSLPFHNYMIPQTLPTPPTLTAQTPTPPVETTPSPTTAAQPPATDSITAQTQTQTLSIGVQALPTLEPIARPKQKVVDIRTFAERPKLSSNLSLKPIANPIKPIIKPTVQPIINTLNQKPIITSITRTPVLAPLSIQPLQLQTPNEPTFILVQNTAQIEPYKFGFDFTDSLGNQQSRKEEISSNGVVTGNYQYIDANGISRQVQYIADENGYEFC